MMKTRILIVDDHPIVRSGIVQLINKEDDIVVCAEAENAADAVDAFIKHNPDIAIVDIKLRHSSGIDLIKQFKSIRQNIPVIVISMHDEQLYIERAFRAGAMGYVNKNSSLTEVRTAIRKVIQGKTHFPPEVMESLLNISTGAVKNKNKPLIEQLSDREFQIFSYLGKGFKPNDIAQELNISVKTVETFRLRIREKLGLKNSKELIQYSIEWFRTHT